MNENKSEFERTEELRRELEAARLEEELKQQAYFNIDDKFGYLLKVLKDAKPKERNETARRFAITITELEKVYAYFDKFISDAR